MSEALPAFQRSCARIARLPATQTLGKSGLAGAAGDWQPLCARLTALAAGDEVGLRALLEREFRPFALSGPEGDQGLVTGYYEVEFKAARARNAEFAAPLYGRPDDMIEVDLGRFRETLAGERLVGRSEGGKLVPYWTRAEIEGGALSGRGAEFLWAADPIELLLLHIQGSGRAILPDGTVQRVGFAASNGHRFTGIGSTLVERGHLPRAGVSMQGVVKWLHEHPAEAPALMNENARYIFFREIEGDGPIGAAGVALTPGRSLAVDPDYLPYGVPLYLDSSYPDGARPLQRLMLAQDTGSAIKGPLRADFFWGAGEAAFEQAGRMKQQARFFLLLPRALAERRVSS